MKIKYSILILLSCVAVSAFIPACKKPKAAVATEANETNAEAAPVDTTAETPPPPPPRKMSNFEYLKQCLSGSFNNSEFITTHPAQLQESFKMMSVLEGSENVFYVYFEQSWPNNSTYPAVVRVFKFFKESDTQFKAFIYKVPEQSQYLNKKPGDPVFLNLDQEEITEIEGCSLDVYFSDESQAFNVSMNKSECGSEMGNSIWKSGLVNIKENLLERTIPGVQNGDQSTTSLTIPYRKE